MSANLVENNPFGSSATTNLTNPASLTPGGVGSTDLSGAISGAAFNPANIDITGFADPLSTNTGLTGVDNTTPSVSASPPDYSTGGTSTAGSTDSSGALSSLISSLSGAVGGLGGLGTLAEYGGLYALLSGQATSAANQNNSLAQQIIDIGSPDVAAGKTLLTSQQSGQLTGPYATAVSNAQAENAKAATSQSQQVAQLLANSSSGNVQSALASEGGQISSQEALANSQAVVQAFQQELSDSLALTGAGGAYIQSGIMQEIQSNTQLQGQLSQLMGMLANAYAKQTSGSGTGTGTGTGANSFSNLLNNLLNAGKNANSVNNLLKNAGSSGASNAATANDLTAQGANAANNLNLGESGPNLSDPLAAPVAGSVFGDTGVGGDLLAGGGYGDMLDESGNIISTASDLNAAQSAVDVASDAGNIGDFLGFNSGDAAAGATDVASSAAAGATDTGAAASVGTGADAAAGLGAVAGGLAAGAGVLAPGIIGALSPAYTLGSDYWATVNSTLKSGLTMGVDDPSFQALAAENDHFQGAAPSNIDPQVWSQLQQKWDNYWNPIWTSDLSNFVAAGGTLDANGNPIMTGQPHVGGGGAGGGANRD